MFGTLASFLRLWIDVATLTGAIYNYLDSYYTGIFSTLPLDDSMVSTLTKYGTDVSELLWRMPIHPSYVEDLAVYDEYHGVDCR